MKEQFKEFYKGDLCRYCNDPDKWTRKFLYYMRKYQTTKSRIIRHYYYFRFIRICEKHFIQMSPLMPVGKGLYLGHAFCITINAQAKLGENINIHKGVTIGQENRGKRKGVPTIGNNVWIGINSTIVGNIHIGNDVLIAPNSYVNCDVPDHSVVIGNPCVIHHRENATENYVINKA